jgi:hypothetical protein
MISQLYIKILLTVPFFSLIYFVLSWIFIGSFALFLIYHMQKKQYQSHSLGYSSLGQDDDDEDLQSFLKQATFNPGLS